MKTKSFTQKTGPPSREAFRAAVCERRVQRCPPELVNVIISDLKLQKLWYTKWLAHGKSWATAIVYEETVQQEITSTEGCSAWLTQGQVEELYNDPVVAEAIVAKCLADPKLWRPHPFVPECKKATQCWVTVREEEKSLLQKNLKRGTRTDGEVDVEDAAKLSSKLWDSDLPASSMRHGVNTSASGPNLEQVEKDTDKEQARIEREKQKEVEKREREKKEGGQGEKGSIEECTFGKSTSLAQRLH